MTNPTTAEKVREWTPRDRLIQQLRNDSNDEAADLICDLTAELASLRRERDGLREQLAKSGKKWTTERKMQVRNAYYADKRLRMKDIAATEGVSISFIGKIIREADASLDTARCAGNGRGDATD